MDGALMRRGPGWQIGSLGFPISNKPVSKTATSSGLLVQLASSLGRDGLGVEAGDDASVSRQLFDFLP